MVRVEPSSQRTRRLDGVDTPAATDAGLSMSARGMLTFVLATGGVGVEEIARVARCGRGEVEGWIEELVARGYAAHVDGGVVVSDDPADIAPLGRESSSGGVEGEDDPGVVWRALAEAEQRRRDNRRSASTPDLSGDPPSPRGGDEARDPVGWHRDRVGTAGHGVALQEPGECVVCGGGTDTAFEGVACHVSCFWVSVPAQRGAVDGPRR